MSLKRLCIVYGGLARRSTAAGQAGVKKAARPLFLTPIPTHREPEPVKSSAYTGQHELMYADIDVFTKRHLPFNTLRQEGLKLLMQKAKEKNITMTEENIASAWDKYMYAREDEAFKKASIMARTLTINSEAVKSEATTAIETTMSTAEDTLQVPSNEEVNLGSTMSFESCEEAFNELCRRFLHNETELREHRAFIAHGPPLGFEWEMSDEGVEDLVHWTEQPLVFLPFETATFEDGNSDMWQLHRAAIIDFHQGKLFISEIRERENGTEDAVDEDEPMTFNELGEGEPRKRLKSREELDEEVEEREAAAGRYTTAMEQLITDEQGNVDIERTLNAYAREQESLHPVERDGDLIEKYLRAREQGFEEYEQDDELDAEDEATLAQLSTSELEALMNEPDETERGTEHETVAEEPEPALDTTPALDSSQFEFNVDPKVELDADLAVLRQLHRLSHLPAADLSQSLSQAVQALDTVELSRPILAQTRPAPSEAELAEEQLLKAHTLPVGAESSFTRPNIREFLDDVKYRAMTGGLSRTDMNQVDEVDDFPRNLTRIMDIPSDVLLGLKTVPWPKLHVDERENFVRFFEVPLTFRDSRLNHNDATYAVQEQMERLDEDENEHMVTEDFDDEPSK